MRVTSPPAESAVAQSRSERATEAQESGQARGLEPPQGSERAVSVPAESL